MKELWKDKTEQHANCFVTYPIQEGSIIGQAPFL